MPSRERFRHLAMSRQSWLGAGACARTALASSQADQQAHTHTVARPSAQMSGMIFIFCETIRGCARTKSVALALDFFVRPKAFTEVQPLGFLHRVQKAARILRFTL